ncbi:MAG: hypothetical protein H6833_14110 [Planctomycetes bacterium]|nr:hypothetical protein [Sandaracinus sp.]MCB9892782.1 hypothetical protein [Planctomycetota bacterium]
MTDANYILVHLDGVDASLDEIEEAVENAVENALGEAGEVTGLGLGATSANVDVAFDPTKLSPGAALELVVAALRRVGVTRATARVGWDLDRGT